MKYKSTVTLTRTNAAAALEELRELLAANGGTVECMAIRRILDRAGIPELESCPSLSHENEAHVDHCLTCAPRWGFVGPFIRIT